MLFEKLIIGKDIKVSTDSIPVKMRHEYPAQHPWWGKPEADKLFGMHIEVPITPIIKQVYSLPEHITHFRLLCLMPEVLPLEKQTAFKKHPFSGSMPELLKIPSCFLGRGDGPEVNETFVSSGLGAIFSVLFGQDKNTEYTQKVLDVLGTTKSSVIASILIHGTNLNRGGEFVTISEAGGAIDFLDSLPSIMLSFEKVYSQPLQVISLLHLMICIIRHEVARKRVNPKHAPTEAEILANQSISSIPPQEVNVATTPVLRGDTHIVEKGSVYSVTEEVALLNNPLSVPMAYALDTVNLLTRAKENPSRGRAITFPDGKTIVGK